MIVVQLNVASATEMAWKALGIDDTDKLCRPASDLLTMEGITGGMVFETICQMVERNVWRPHPEHEGYRCLSPPNSCDIAILRLRIVDGSSLKEIGLACKLSRERVRQRLHIQFGMTGEPPAALERRRRRLMMGPPLERMIALRLNDRPKGMTISSLLHGFTAGSPGRDARDALYRMQAKGFLTIQGDLVTPTRALHQTAHERASAVTSGSTDRKRTRR